MYIFSDTLIVTTIPYTRHEEERCANAICGLAGISERGFDLRLLKKSNGKSKCSKSGRKRKKKAMDFFITRL